MVKDIANKQHGIAYIVVIFKGDIKLLVNSGITLKTMFYANPLSILSPFTHM